MEFYEKCIIYGDIKLDNILINKMVFWYECFGVKFEVKMFYEVKISDLGLVVQCVEYEVKER